MNSGRFFRGRTKTGPGTFCETPDVDAGTLVKFHCWMQEVFESLGERRIMLSPVFDVSWMHVPPFSISRKVYVAVMVSSRRID